MHKIKEILHKDNEDANVSTSRSAEPTTEKHGLFHHGDNSSSSSTSEKHSGGLFHHGDSHKKEGHDTLSTREFEHGHMHHGEIEHGGHQHEHVHMHEQPYEHEHSSHHHHGEKHIMHEREVLKDGGDRYKGGYDPTVNREVISSSSHDGGVHRHRIDESKIVKETVKQVELHKIQPVVHREREQKEIRHVVEPHKKFEVKDTKIHHRERDIDLGVRREASTLETSRSVGHAPHIESSREFLGKERQHQELPVRVEEHVHRKIEEHVHPVVYKEVLRPKVTEETHHIYEKVKEAPIETYVVKEVGMQRGEGLREAERDFFARESARGIVLGEGHSCNRDIDHHHGHHLEHGQSHEHKLHKDNSHKLHKDQSHKLHKDKSHKHHDLKRSGEMMTIPAMHSHSHTYAAPVEPIIGHHQNIGAHHLAAGSVPAGHNTAYDAALCNQCTDNAICSHSVRDADRMKKMNEKKIAKDEKLTDKQQKKMEKSSSSGVAHTTVV